MKSFMAFTAALLALAAAATGRQYWTPVTIPDKVPARAMPFPLGDVRLLDGPYRDAMIRDQEYLLSLDQDR